ncbi:MAG: hypothetical protein IKU68_03500 [Oscillospiraceae bacterium]|nr:hypothetical protein [Oscillospiraceae bacterium]
MDNQIKESFDAIQASEQLKRRTKAALRKKTFDYGRNVYRIRQHHRRLATGLMSLVLTISGLGLWFLPTTNIAVDINPSIDIRVNALDRVICVEGTNADGVELAKHLDVAGMPYDDAVQRILLDKDLERFLENNQMISISMAGNSNEARLNDMANKVLCRAYSIAGKENIFYCQVDMKTIQAARAENLCIPRYLAWKRMLKTDPTVTTDEIRELSIEQIRILSQVEIVDDPCH